MRMKTGINSKNSNQRHENETGEKGGGNDLRISTYLHLLPCYARPAIYGRPLFCHLLTVRRWYIACLCLALSLEHDSFACPLTRIFGAHDASACAREISAAASAHLSPRAQPHSTRRIIFAREIISAISSLPEISIASHAASVTRAGSCTCRRRTRA